MRDQPNIKHSGLKEDNSLETDALTIKPSNNPDNISQDARRAFRTLLMNGAEAESFGSSSRPINRNDIKDDNEGVSGRKKSQRSKPPSKGPDFKGHLLRG